MRLTLSIAFESERPFRMLVRACSGFQCASDATRTAHYLFMRLWVDLALEARATDRLGFLSAESMELWDDKASLDLGGGRRWSELLVSAGLVERLEDGGFHCPHFNVDGMNNACRRGYQMAQSKGGTFGGHGRRTKRVAMEAESMALTLLGPDEQVYHDLSGNPMDLTRRTAAFALLCTLDNSLKLPARPRNHASFWPPGELALADSINEKHAAETINVNGRATPATHAVALYLLANGDDPRLPKGTMQALQAFETLVLKAKAWHKAK